MGIFSRSVGNPDAVMPLHPDRKNMATLPPRRRVIVSSKGGRARAEKYRKLREEREGKQ
jgi:hypothetical protein